MVPYDSVTLRKRALSASASSGSKAACRTQGSFLFETSVAGSNVFDAASLEPLLDIIKDAPQDVQASIYVFYCEAISNVIHHAYNDKATAPKHWWTAALKIDPSTYHYIFTVADEGRGLEHALPCAVKGDALTAVGRWSKLLKAPRRNPCESRGQGLASFARLVQALRGSRLTVESNSARCTYSENAGAEVSALAASRRGLKVALDLAPETVGGVA